MAKTPKHILETKHEAYSKDPDAFRAKSRANYHKHRDKRILSQKEKYQENKLEINESKKVTRKSRNDSGLCHCGSTNDGTGLTCLECKNKSRRHYQKRREQGLCACGRNPESGKARCSVCRDRGQKYAKVQRAEMIEAYGGKCNCPGCNEKEPTFLALDHIFNDGALDRRDTRGGNAFISKLRKQGFPKDRFQLLCHNCNFAKRLGTCPHILQSEADDYVWDSPLRCSLP